MNSPISVEATINAPLEKAWRYHTEPEHVMKWNNASEDWHTPRAENDLRVGGRFLSRMEAKDGSAGFDFAGTYDEVVPMERTAYHMEDGRKVQNVFTPEGEGTRVTATFDPENENSLEMQRGGWQSILDNFKKHVEAN